MRLISIEIENILSIEKATLNFEGNGLLLVDGWNYDVNRANGAGKTAVFNTVSFAIYDRIPRKITASEILRRGAEKGIATATVQCGQDRWVVKRSRPKGVEFFKNGVKENITQKEFETHLRLTYDQFVLTMYTAQSASGGTDRFLLKSDTDKKTFLLRLLDLEKFASAKKLADLKIADLSKEIDSLNLKISNGKSKIGVYQESLVDLDLLSDNVTKLNKSILIMQKECDELSSIPKPDLSKYLKLEDNLNAKRNELLENKTRRGMLHDTLRVLQRKAGHKDSGVCSECGSTTKTPESVEKHKTELNRQMESIKLQIDACDEILSKEQEVNALWSKLKDKKAKESQDYQSASQRLIEVRPLLASKEAQIKAIELKMNENATLIAKIQAIEESLTTQRLSLEKKKESLLMYETVANIYSPTGAQAYILDSIVDLFNDTISEFVDIVWPNASYQIQSQKENSKGEMVAKFSEVLMMGKDEVSVGSLSGGEFKALSLCVDFTLLDILSKQFGIDLNPIILDEPFDGLDSAGKVIVTKLLEQLAQHRQIIVVDHTSEARAMFSNVIKVVKRDGISSIQLEA